MLRLPMLMPREKIKYYGVDTLTINELIMVILGQGTKHHSLYDMSHQCLTHFDSLVDLKTASIEELTQINGIGEAKACELLAAIELGHRILLEERTIFGRVYNSEVFGNYLMRLIGHLSQEELMLFCLNIKNQIVAQKVVFIGSVSESLACPREIFYYAIKSMATSIVIAHNHPSGQCKPSQNDFLLTNRVKDTGEVVGIKLLDHFIVGHHEYISFRESHFL